MGDLSRFDVAERNGVAMVVVESDLQSPDTCVVVIPRLSGYPAAQHLNSAFHLQGGRRLVRATRLIAAVRRPHLRRTGTVADQGDLITRAVDVLLAGVWRA